MTLAARERLTSVGARFLALSEMYSADAEKISIKKRKDRATSKRIAAAFEKLSKLVNSDVVMSEAQFEYVHGAVLADAHGEKGSPSIIEILTFVNSCRAENAKTPQAGGIVKFPAKLKSPQGR